MKIEHITLGGNAVIRDTAEILPQTKKYFAPVGWEYKSQILNLPGLPFAIKITATDEGVIFDIQKAGEPVVMNVCGFDGDKSTLKHVSAVADLFEKHIPGFGKVIEPVTPNWLYSIVVNPLTISSGDMMIAGEVELYIFEQLYNAWQKREK
jgi:hypothetical protein